MTGAGRRACAAFSARVDSDVGQFLSQNPMFDWHPCADSKRMMAKPTRVTIWRFVRLSVMSDANTIQYPTSILQLRTKRGTDEDRLKHVSGKPRL